MKFSTIMTQNQTIQREEVLVHEDDEIKRLEQCLPKAAIMGSKHYHIVKYQNFWLPGDNIFKSIVMFQKHFHAQNTDLIIASLPKTGTTWLKSLLFAVVNRAHHPISQSPLLAHNPHELVYRLENGIYGDHAHNYLRPSQLNDLRSPRLLNTHLPYTSLPESIKTSDSRILFISRNPLDTFVSQWHFYTKLGKKKLGDDMKPCSIQDYFEDCMDGKIPYGPFFEHVVDYWNKSLERPHKVLFLKYEDLKDDPTLHLKRVAEFVGMPFSPQEENSGVIGEIIELCSINNMKKLEVNKEGVIYNGLDTKEFFRKGEVGDWTNYFTAPMVERLEKLMQEKLQGTGLTFKSLPK